MTSPRLLALIAALLAAGFGGAAEASHCSGPLPQDALREAELVVEGVARARREVNGKLFYLVEVTRVFKGTPRRWIIVRQCMQCIWMKPDTPSYSFLREDRGLWTAVDCYDGHPVAEHQADLAKPLNEQRRNVYGAELNVERLLQPLPGVFTTPGPTLPFVLWHQPWLVLVFVLGAGSLVRAAWLWRSSPRRAPPQRHSLRG